MVNKQLVFKNVQLEIEQREKRIQSAFDDLNSAILNDSKSTAGDKHETGRAMIHLEQEKLSKQLNQTKLLKETLAQIEPKQKHSKIQFGSLVETNKGFFFLSVGLGKIKVGNDVVFCLTATTPLGEILLNKGEGAEITFNGLLKVLSVE